MFKNVCDVLSVSPATINAATGRSRILRQPLILVALAILCVATVSSSYAQTFTTITTGVGSPYDSPLIQGTDGNFYGVESNSVFKITPQGALTTLYTFCNTCGIDPSGALAQGADGDFYGTTRGEGTKSAGTVFKISRKGVFTSLYTFDNSDGTSPNGGLLQGTDGEFYGTTALNGGNRALGTIFKISPTGVLTTLYAFPSSGSQGGEPAGGLVQASDGNFYGDTSIGGGSGCRGNNGCGTIFEIAPSGTLTTLALLQEPDGDPQSSLALGSDGNLYGTANTTQGGAAFEATPGGAVSTLYTFASGDGSEIPIGGLVQGTDGNLYGTTELAGGLPCNTRFTTCGTVFQLTPSGELTTLYSFTGGTNGENPITTLLQATNGIFYGRTSSTIFSLSLDLAPFVTPQPKLGSVGNKITILGNNLTGTAAVSFNGTPATFTAGESAILATVPAGATSGTITVTTPSGTLSSNVVFTVTP